MPNYLTEAFTTLSLHARFGGPLCDKVAEALTGMASGALARLNRDLDFSWFTMRDLRVTNADERQKAISERRAAMLSAKALRMDGALLQAAESWDLVAHERVFSAAYRAQGTPAPAFFLKGSFWAFSSEGERDWTRQSWSDALDLVRAGMEVAKAASIAGSRDENIVFSRYFGNSPALTVYKNLDTLHTAMSFKTCGITYMGAGLAGNTDYQELGPLPRLSTLEYQGRATTEWGWAVSGDVHNTIGYNARFFVPADTAIKRAQLHDVTAGAMAVSRGGAIVHELTHRYLKTKDLVIPVDVLMHIGRQSKHGLQTYGPYACCAVGKFAPAEALTNADTYRVFCEDAWASRHGARVTATPALPVGDDLRLVA